MLRSTSMLCGMLLAAVLAGCAGASTAFRGVLVPYEALSIVTSLPSDRNLGHWKRRGFNALSVRIEDSISCGQLDWLRGAAKRVGLPLYLWIDVGRNPKLAEAHPEWVAGMGSHEDWRRLFPQAPKPGPGERVGMFPWTPIWYRAVLEDRRAAIVRLLRGHTEGLAGVFLNQIQGAPSACGCGNLQCRWTVDYNMPGGPEKVEGSPPAVLIAGLKIDLPGVLWIPVVVTECEEKDQGEGGTGYCGSVHCFTGRCWQESTRELEALSKEAEGPLALLLAQRQFRRGAPDDRGGAAWIAQTMANLATIPPKHGHPPLAAGRLLAVVEGATSWQDVNPTLEDQVRASGAAGVLVSPVDLDEGWEPRVLPGSP